MCLAVEKCNKLYVADVEIVSLELASAWSVSIYRPLHQMDSIDQIIVSICFFRSMIHQRKITDSPRWYFLSPTTEACSYDLRSNSIP